MDRFSITFHSTLSENVFIPIFTVNVQFDFY